MSEKIVGVVDKQFAITYYSFIRASGIQIKAIEEQNFWNTLKRYPAEGKGLEYYVELIYGENLDALVIHFSEPQFSDLVLELSQVYPLIVLLSRDAKYSRQILTLPHIYREKNFNRTAVALCSLLQDDYFWSKDTT